MGREGVRREARVIRYPSVLEEVVTAPRGLQAGDLPVVGQAHRLSRHDEGAHAGDVAGQPGRVARHLEHRAGGEVRVTEPAAESEMARDAPAVGVAVGAALRREAAGDPDPSRISVGALEETFDTRIR